MRRQARRAMVVIGGGLALLVGCTGGPGNDGERVVDATGAIRFGRHSHLEHGNRSQPRLGSIVAQRGRDRCDIR